MPLTEWDAYLIHQIPGTIDTVGTNDPHFTGRMAFICYDSDGTLYFFAGLGTYPNVNVMDGFVCIRHNQLQRNIRISRHLQNDRADTEIGMLSFKVLEPLNRWSIHLGDNQFGIECSLEFNGRVAPYIKAMDNAEDAQSHYNQVGIYTGVIRLDDHEFEVDRFIGVRDRSWGVRRPGVMRMFDVYFWIHAHFTDFTLSFIYLDVLGGGRRIREGVMLYDDGRSIPITNIQHRVEFLPQSKIYRKIIWLLECADGIKRHLIATPLSPPADLAGAGYDDRHGLDRGLFHIEGEEWNVNQVTSSDPWRFLYTHRVLTFQLDQAVGKGLLESSFGHPEDWQYTPTF